MLDGVTYALDTANETIVAQEDCRTLGLNGWSLLKKLMSSKELICPEALPESRLSLSDIANNATLICPNRNNGIIPLKSRLNTLKEIIKAMRVGGQALTTVEEKSGMALPVIELPLHFSSSLINIFSESTKNAEFAEILLELGLHCQAKDKISSIHLAAMSGKIDLLQNLMNRGASLCEKTGCGYLPLHFACMSGKEKMVQYLLEAGADPNAKTNSGLTGLHLAAEGSSVETVNHLLTAGADIKARTEGGETVLHCYTQQGSNPNVMSALINADAPLDIQESERCMTPLMLAARKNLIENMDILLNAGAKVNSLDDKGNSVLHILSGKDRSILPDDAIEKVEAMIIKIATMNPVLTNMQNKKKKTPLMLAVENRFVNALSAMLKNKGDTRKTRYRKNNLLHFLYENTSDEVESDDHVTIATILVNHDHALLNETNRNGYTPLRIAAQKFLLNSVKFLVEAGTDVTLKDADSTTTLQYLNELDSKDMTRPYREKWEEMVACLKNAEKNKSEAKPVLIEESFDLPFMESLKKVGLKLKEKSIGLDENTKLKFIFRDGREVILKLYSYSLQPEKNLCIGREMQIKEMECDENYLTFQLQCSFSGLHLSSSDWNWLNKITYLKSDGTVEMLEKSESSVTIY